MIGPTRIRALALLAAACLAVGWALVAFVESAYQRLLQVPWTAAAALALMAVSLLIWGLVARPRLQRKQGRPPMDPLVATRTAALAMAASRTGAAVMGFYGGVALGLLPSWDTPAGRSYGLAAGAAVLASLALAGVGLWVESICRLPGDGKGEQGEGDGSTRRGQPGRASNEAAPAGRRLLP